MQAEKLSKTSRTKPEFHHELEEFQSDPRAIVTYDGPDDPYNPLNWPFSQKMKNTFLYGFTTMGSTWASSIYSTTVPAMNQKFHVSNEVSILGLTLFPIGFGLGPLIWAPVSELYGRKISILIPCIISACFVFGTATAENLQTVIITRLTHRGVFHTALGAVVASQICIGVFSRLVLHSVAPLRRSDVVYDPPQVPPALFMSSRK